MRDLEETSLFVFSKSPFGAMALELEAVIEDDVENVSSSGSMGGDKWKFDTFFFSVLFLTILSFSSYVPKYLPEVKLVVDDLTTVETLFESLEHLLDELFFLAL